MNSSSTGRSRGKMDQKRKKKKSKSLAGNLLSKSLMKAVKNTRRTLSTGSRSSAGSSSGTDGGSRSDSRCAGPASAGLSDLPPVGEVGVVDEYELVAGATSKAHKLLGIGAPTGSERDAGGGGGGGGGGKKKERHRVSFDPHPEQSRSRESSFASHGNTSASSGGEDGGGPYGSRGGSKRTSRDAHSSHSSCAQDEGGLALTDAGNRKRVTRQTIDHMELLFATDFEDLVQIERLRDWAASFRRLDPRFTILKYFNDIALGGVEDIDTKGVTRAELVAPLLQIFRRAAVFTVWRPTSMVAIKKMMLGHGTGKGLNVKGKSAKDGKLSGYVPFVQIHEEKHKNMIRELPKDAKIRVFYRKPLQRKEAVERLEAVRGEMLKAVEEAKRLLGESGHHAAPGEMGAHDHQDHDDEKNNKAVEMVRKWDMEDPAITLIDDYGRNKGWGPFAQCYGVEIPERLFWEAFVVREEVHREPGSEYDTKRGSIPEFQDMNFVSTRNWKPGDPRAVVWQYANPKEEEGPMDPRTLLLAYEENNKVLPVVSDFDCFLVGTRGVSYKEQLPPEQVEIMDWCINHIENTLDNPGPHAWSRRWLDVLKYHKPTGKGAKLPKLGYADPKSYSIMRYAVGRLKENGAVRHGAECFNYYFPQDLDDEYLVILGDADAGKVPWIYVNEEQLREVLCDKIRQGFTFPLNPKWVLCDPGWRKVYDLLKASQKANVQDSLNCWYPPESGLRERIESISEKHPDGFVQVHPDNADDGRQNGHGRPGHRPSKSIVDASEAMDIAELELEHYEALQRAKRRLFILLQWIVLGQRRKKRGGVDEPNFDKQAESQKTREYLQELERENREAARRREEADNLDDVTDEDDDETHAEPEDGSVSVASKS